MFSRIMVTLTPPNCSIKSELTRCPVCWGRYHITIPREDGEMKNNFRYLFVVVCFFASMDSLHAQWVRTNPAYGGNILSLVISGTYLFAGTGGSGVFLSTNSGASWTQVDTGLTNSTVNALAASGPDIFAGTDGGGVFLSTNNGTDWAQVDSGLTDHLYLSSCCLRREPFCRDLWWRGLSFHQ